MNFYNIFGEYITIEKFTETSEETKNTEDEKLIDYNVYSHIVFSSKDNSKRLKLYPLYIGEKGLFNLSLSGDKNIKNMVIKDSADSSYINNPIHIDKLLVDGKELDRNLFKTFRIYNGKLQMIDNGNKINLSYDSETNKITNLDKPSLLHLFDFSPTGSEVNVFNNDPEASFYKVNITRDTFYLTTNKDMKEFVKTVNGTTENKNEASIFTFKEIDPNQKVRNQTRINIPAENKDSSGAVKNIEQILQQRARKVLFSESHKFNLYELIKDSNDNIKENKIKLIKDEIRGGIVFVPLTDNDEKEKYQLHVWVNEK